MDQFIVTHCLGRGSFGTCHLVRRKKDHRFFVIKEINVFELDGERRMEAENEVNVLEMVDHPNIISYYDSFIEKHALYIVMDYCDRGTLHDALKSQLHNFLTEEAILDIFVQVAMALEYLHRNRILHRDLKPQNIFLSKSPDPFFTQVRVGDFGLARVLGPESLFAETVLGTPFHLSPELCEGRPYNEKSDVWALGTILYELVMRRRAFQAKSLPQLVHKITRRDMEAPNASRVAVRVEVLDLINRMLELDPSRRPPMTDVLAIPFVKAHAEVVKRKLAVYCCPSLRKTFQPPLDDDDDNNEFRETVLDAAGIDDQQFRWSMLSRVRQLTQYPVVSRLSNSLPSLRFFEFPPTVRSVVTSQHPSPMLSPGTCSPPRGLSPGSSRDRSPQKSLSPRASPGRRLPLSPNRR
eukprot:Rmarinus@m.11058